MRYRVGILGDVGTTYWRLVIVGVGKTTLLHLFLKKTELTTVHATNGQEMNLVDMDELLVWIMKYNLEFVTTSAIDMCSVIFLDRNVCVPL